MLMFQMEERDKNVRTRYNGRQFLSWYHDVMDKFDKIKVTTIICIFMSISRCKAFLGSTPLTDLAEGILGLYRSRWLPLLSKCEKVCQLTSHLPIDR